MEEKKKQPKSLPGMSIEWYESLKTDEDWLEYRTLELMDAGFSEEEIASLFYYDSETRHFYPTAEMMEQWDNERQWFQEDRSYYLEAIAKGRRNPFPNIDFDECQNNVETEVCAEQIEPLSPEENQAKIRMYSHMERLSLLYKHGLEATNVKSSENSRLIDSSYTIDGHRYNNCVTLFHNTKELGLFYDEFSFPGNYVSHERHVDNLLKVVSKNKVYLLLIYFEKDGQPTWEMYYKGRFIRQQSTVYTYEGYLYDKKKMVRIYELSKGTETDIGLLLQALYQLNNEAKEIANYEERQIRVAENERQHTALTELVSKMQQHAAKADAVFHLEKLNGDLTEEKRDAFYAHLDSVASTIPEVVAIKYEQMARDTYVFYDNVAASSQRFLRTAVALEESLTAGHHDICPLYFELCRVFENELDIRIFSEYIGKLVSSQDSDAAQTGGKEYCFRRIGELVSNARRIDSKVFVPEKIKIEALHKVNFNIEKASFYQKTLFDLLIEKGFDLKRLERKSDYYKNCDYVESRNKFVHPDDKLDALAAHGELERIKQHTTKRLEWLIEATEQAE